MIKRGKAQVWVETVVYTLIGLTIMGLLLGVVVPRIQQLTDRLTINDALENTMASLEQNLIEVQSNPNEERYWPWVMKKGELVIDGINDTIIYTLRGTKFKASEPGVLVKERGNIYRLTQSVSGKYDVSLILDYSFANLTFNGKDDVKKFSSASTTYQIQIQNLGNNQINFQLL